MRSPAFSRRVPALLGFLALAGASHVGSEDAALGLSLRKTYLKTQDGSFLPYTGWNALFSPTTVNCPDEVGSSCVIRIEVSSVLSLVAPDSTVLMRARVGSYVARPGVVQVESTTGPGGARTFTWMQTGVANGNWTVHVDVDTTNGAVVVVGSRTL